MQGYIFLIHTLLIETISVNNYIIKLVVFINLYWL